MIPRMIDGKRGPSQLSFSGSEGRRLLLSVVLPCHNEEEVLRETNRRLFSALENIPMQLEVIYVDDGSTDSTAEILRDLQMRRSAHPRRALLPQFRPSDGHHRRHRARLR